MKPYKVCPTCAGSGVVNVPTDEATSSVSVRYILEGHRAQRPCEWSEVRTKTLQTLEEAKSSEIEYREYNEIAGTKGYIDFRIMRVTTTAEQVKQD